MNKPKRLNPKDYTCKTCRYRGKIEGCGYVYGHQCQNERSEYHSTIGGLTGFGVYCPEWKAEQPLEPVHKDGGIKNEKK